MELFIVGPAGSGKSSFVRYFSEYLKNNNYSVRCVNLDPATKPVYKVDADIRKFVKTESVMNDLNLGINSALIKSVELSRDYVDKLKFNADYVLYDTPGQMDLFIYSENGRKIVDELSSKFTTGIFLMDLTVVKDSESFLSAVMENVIVSLRLTIPSLTVFNKSDIEDVNIELLKNNISKREGLLAELLEKAIFFIEYTTIPQRTIKISNFNKTGYDDLFSAINELFCECGDLS